MISHDQPTIFGNDVIVAVSSVDDGNMSLRKGDPSEALANREAFLATINLTMDTATLMQITFDGVTDFARYVTIDDSHKGEGMFGTESNTIADALVVTKPGHSLFLPLADCTATVIYDPAHHVLMLSHIGRQSAEVNGGVKSIEYLQSQFDTDPAGVKVWLGPAVGKESYQLYRMDNKGLHEAIIEQLLSAGVSKDNIEESVVNTAKDDNYFSHSEFFNGRQSVDSRFVVVAAMREQGEPAS